MKSMAQRRFLHANLPGVAAKFEAHTPKGADLPDHAHQAKKRHTGADGARELGRASHVSAHSATHIKSRMKRFT